MRFAPVTALLAPLALLALGSTTACIPYTVGSTAQTIPQGQTSHTTSWYFIPNALKSPDDSIAAPMYGVDNEWRHGVDGRSDVGVRVTPAGVVVNYKHRMGDAPAGKAGVAYMVGSGIVNGGEHLHLEATLIASGDESSGLMPYGGVRAMHVIPISSGAVTDRPTLGAFGGFQMGDASFTLRPELGVYYDHSALGLRKSNVIIVPAVTLQRGRRKSEVATIEPQRMSGKAPVEGSGPSVLRCLFFSCGSSTLPPVIR
jgi:hypothetical protein